MPQELLLIIAGASISLVSSLLTLIVGNIFQRKNDERKRKWELEDREFNRKINAKDDRLQEAQAYLDAYREALLKLLSLETRLLMYDPNKDESYIAQAQTQFSERFDEIRNITNFSFKRLSTSQI